jgi:DNA polymerase-3 subunit beta
MDDLDILIPHKALEDFAKLTADYDGPVKIAASENSIHFIAGERLLSSRMQVGEFPAFDQIIDNVSTGMIDVLFQGAELAGAIKRSALAADAQSSAVMFDFSPTELTLTAATSKSGESQESILIEFSGVPFKMSLNARYLLDFLQTADSGQVLLGVKDARSAIRMRTTKEGISTTYVVMPMAKNPTE